MSEEQKRPATEAEVVAAMYDLWPTIGQRFTPRETVPAMLAAARALGCLLPEDAAALRADRDKHAMDAALSRTFEKAAHAERDTLAARMKVAEDALRRWQDTGCPDCSGDCGSANPPVLSCIMQETRSALTPPPSAGETR